MKPRAPRRRRALHRPDIRFVQRQTGPDTVLDVIDLMLPISERGRAWLEAHADGREWLEGALVIEPAIYTPGSLLAAARAAGLGITGCGPVCGTMLRNLRIYSTPELTLEQLSSRLGFTTPGVATNGERRANDPKPGRFLGPRDASLRRVAGGERAPSRRGRVQLRATVGTVRQCTLLDLERPGCWRRPSRIPRPAVRRLGSGIEDPGPALRWSKHTAAVPATPILRVVTRARGVSSLDAAFPGSSYRLQGDLASVASNPTGCWEATLVWILEGRQRRQQRQRGL